MLSELPKHVESPDPRLYHSNNYVVVDFETTTLYKGSPLVPENRLVLACWWTPDGGMKHCFGSEYEQGELLEAVAKADFIVAHNAKFELGWLRRCGLNLREAITFDTMIGEYVIGGNRYMLRQLSLKACLERRELAGKEDLVTKMFNAGISSENVPESWLLRYCERDVMACHELFRLVLAELVEKELEAVNYQRNLVTPVLADMEFAGMQLDSEQVKTMMADLDIAYAKATKDLQNFCEGAMPSSPKQIAEYVFDRLGFAVPRDYKGTEMRTKTGAYSVSAEVMARLKATNPKQEEFIRRYNEWTNMHSDFTKYIKKFNECCEEDGGLLHAVFNQCNTATQRLSSSGFKYGAQFQNLNRAFKPMFKARNEGWLMGEADGSGAEFRSAGHLGRDAQVLADIINGTDIHSFTASIVGTNRQDAKKHTFKPLYGGKSGTPNEQKYYSAFAEKYQGISNTQRDWTYTVLEDKQLRIETGLIYYWPYCSMSASGYISNTTSIYNYPVQNFATAEVIPLGMVCAWHRMDKCKSFLVNTVHDSIIAEVHPDEQELWSDVAYQALVVDPHRLMDKLYGIKITVPLGADVTIGPRWADAIAKKSEKRHEAPKELWLSAAQEAGML